MVYLSSGMPIWASTGDDLYLARNFSVQRDYKNALIYYERYLNALVFHDQYAAQVIEASLMLTSVEQQQKFIVHYVKKAPRLVDRMLLYRHLAFLAEYLQDYRSAIAYYRLAYEASRPIDYRLYLRAAILNFELDEYARALYIARQVLPVANNAAMKNEVLLIMFRSLFALPDALTQVQALLAQEHDFIRNQGQPNLLYLLYLGHVKYHDTAKSRDFRAQLLQRYPHSLEALLVQGKIKEATTPSLLWW